MNDPSLTNDLVDEVVGIEQDAHDGELDVCILPPARDQNQGLEDPPEERRDMCGGCVNSIWEGLMEGGGSLGTVLTPLQASGSPPRMSTHCMIQTRNSDSTRTLLDCDSHIGPTSWRRSLPSTAGPPSGTGPTPRGW